MQIRTRFLFIYRSPFPVLLILSAFVRFPFICYVVIIVIVTVTVVSITAVVVVRPPGAAGPRIHFLKHFSPPYPPAYPQPYGHKGDDDDREDGRGFGERNDEYDCRDGNLGYGVGVDGHVGRDA